MFSEVWELVTIVTGVGGHAIVRAVNNGEGRFPDSRGVGQALDYWKYDITITGVCGPPILYVVYDHYNSCGTITSSKVPDNRHSQMADYAGVFMYLHLIMLQLHE